MLHTTIRLIFIISFLWIFSGGCRSTGVTQSDIAEVVSLDSDSLAVQRVCLAETKLEQVQPDGKPFDLPLGAVVLAQAATLEANPSKQLVKYQENLGYVEQKALCRATYIPMEVCGGSSTAVLQAGSYLDAPELVRLKPADEVLFYGYDESGRYGFVRSAEQVGWLALDEICPEFGRRSLCQADSTQIYTEPNFTSEVLTALTGNKTVQVLFDPQQDDHWDKVRFNETVGFVNKEYLCAQKSFGSWLLPYQGDNEGCMMEHAKVSQYIKELNYSIPMYGISFGVYEGTDVSAMRNGTVANVGWDDSLGNIVTINHDSGYQSKYAHLSEVTAVDGEQVSAGQVIGKTGNSGSLTTVPSLYVEIKQNSRLLDPFIVLKNSLGSELKVCGNLKTAPDPITSIAPIKSYLQ